MSSPQISTGFGENSQLDFFKCLLLFKKVELERDKNSEDPSKAHTREKLFAMKRSLDISQYISDVDSLTLEKAETMALENFLKIRIWKQVDRKKPVFLEYESKIETNAESFSDFDIFSKSFDTFANQDFSNILLILDIEKFLSKKKYSPSENKPMFRRMTIFQATVSELWPKLNGSSFAQKVKDLEEKWGEKSFHLTDAKKFHDLYGLGIQIWTLIPKPNRHYEIRKIWDSIYKKKLRIRIENFDLEERFPLTLNIEYIYDEVAIQYYSCPNKNCFFGTNRQDRLERHKKSCRTSTIISYRQERYAKPKSEVREQLVAEGILPNLDFENQMYACYDIGKTKMEYKPQVSFTLNFMINIFILLFL